MLIFVRSLCSILGYFSLGLGALMFVIGPTMVSLVFGMLSVVFAVNARFLGRAHRRYKNMLVILDKEAQNGSEFD